LGTTAAESCINSAFVNVGALNREWLAAGRLDWNVSDRHRIFFRVTVDHGQQPSFVSLINPTWNMVSIQPNYTGQLNDIYSFSPTLTNQLIVSSLSSSRQIWPRPSPLRPPNSTRPMTAEPMHWLVSDSHPSLPMPLRWERCGTIFLEAPTRRSISSSTAFPGKRRTTI
jgi:hypothetical protein